MPPPDARTDRVGGTTLTDGGAGGVGGAGGAGGAGVSMGLHTQADPSDLTA